MDTPYEVKFANPRLATIAASAEFKPRKSLLRSVLYDAVSWLVIPAGFLFITIALIEFESVFSFMCTFHDISLPNFIANSFARLGCGANILTPIYTFLKVSLLSGSYLIVTSVFFRARRWAKRQRLNALGSLRRDGRDPVLYLRSFATEVAANPDRRSLKTYEEDLALALNHIGPVVAVGEPGEELPLLGATRIYMKQDNWQHNVQELISISQLVVINVGLSNGLIWEFGAAIRNTSPSKLLISFLSWADLDETARIARYHHFKERVSEIIRQSNPDRTITLPDVIGNATFLVFRDDWTPELVRPNKWKNLFFRFSTAVSMNETLRPILKRRGLKLKRWKTILYCFYMFLIILGVANIISSILSVFYNLQQMSSGPLPQPSQPTTVPSEAPPLPPIILVPLIVLVILLGLLNFSANIMSVLIMIWLFANLIKFVFNLMTSRRKKYTLIRMNE